MCRRAQAAEETGRRLENAFAFLEQSLGESQELVLFATELTAGFHTSWFLQNFGSEAYYRHNRSLLFHDAQAQLLRDISEARKAPS